MRVKEIVTIGEPFSEARSPDSAVATELATGLRLTGSLATSPVFESREHLPAVDREWFHQRP